MSHQRENCLLKKLVVQTVRLVLIGPIVTLSLVTPDRPLGWEMESSRVEIVDWLNNRGCPFGFGKAHLDTNDSSDMWLDWKAENTQNGYSWWRLCVLIGRENFLGLSPSLNFISIDSFCATILVKNRQIKLIVVKNSCIFAFLTFCSSNYWLLLQVAGENKSLVTFWRFFRVLATLLERRVFLKTWDMLPSGPAIDQFMFTYWIIICFRLK